MMSALLILALHGCGGGEAPASDAASADPAPTESVAKPEAKPEAEAPSGSGDAGGPLPAGDSAKGKAVYDQYCTACHQADGTGMGGMLAANFVTDKARLEKSDAELAKSIKEGVTGSVGTMPPWGSQLSDQEVADVLAYIRATYGK